MWKRRQSFPLTWTRLTALSASTICVFALGACDGEALVAERARPASAVTVVSHTISFQREVVRVETVGTARARASAVIYPETGGEVVEVLFETGDFVKANAPLLKLESREEALAVRLAEVEVRDAEQLLARYQRIEDTGAVSDSQIDEGRTAVDAARIALDQARNALAERTVVAPFSGHVGLSDIDAGARVAPATEIARLDDRRVLHVDFEAPEQVFGRIAVGDKVSVAPFANEGAETTAIVIELDSRIDPASRTLIVRAEIDNADDALRPGMSFRVVTLLDGAAYAAVPEAAVLWGSDGAYVWRIDGDETRRAPVEIMAREQGFVLVSGDLAEGSSIVLEGIQKVRDGTKISNRRAGDGFTAGAASAESPS